MTGILLIVAVMVWLIVAFFLVKLITLRLPRVWWVHLLQVLLFLAVIPLPLVDEIVGKRQFEKLCSENGTIHVDRSKVAGKTVYLADLPDTEIKGTWVPVVLKPWRFVDADSGEVLVSYNTLLAVGGVFIRTLGISEGNVPLTFKGYCEPGGRVDPLKLFREVGITQIQRSALGPRGQK